MASFLEFHFNKHLTHALQAQKFDTPTPVQQQAIPAIIAGSDVLACAQTGTGKTGAFCFPIIHRLLENPRGFKSPAPRAVILTPTRELAGQVHKTLETFTKGGPLRTTLIVGGVSYEPQIRALNGTTDILIATPGRLIDHLNEKRVDLSEVETFVLDEADRMLDMGFIKPVEQIITPMPDDRQTLLFSATFDKDVENLAKRFLTNPTEVKLAPATQNHENITQSLIYTTDKLEKIDTLKVILNDSNVWQAIVFMRTKHATDSLAKKINNWGIKAACLHGDMKQNARKRVIEQLHKGTLQVVVATDVAARGIDVKNLSHVINFDLPQQAEDYVHRIGRTGRAGASGTAISFASRLEFDLLNSIEKLIGQKIPAENDRPANPSKTKKNSKSVTIKKPDTAKKKASGTKKKKPAPDRKRSDTAQKKPASKLHKSSPAKKAALTTRKKPDSAKSHKKSGPKAGTLKHRKKGSPNRSKS